MCQFRGKMNHEEANTCAAGLGLILIVSGKSHPPSPSSPLLSLSSSSDPWSLELFPSTCDHRCFLSINSVKKLDFFAALMNLRKVSTRLVSRRVVPVLKQLLSCGSLVGILIQTKRYEFFELFREVAFELRGRVFGDNKQHSHGVKVSVGGFSFCHLNGCDTHRPNLITRQKNYNGLVKGKTNDTSAFESYPAIKGKKRRESVSYGM